MPGPSFRLSILDGELLALTMTTHATPMFTLTDSASRPEISALQRAGRLEMQTHQICPPRRLSPLEWIVTRHRRAPASSFESALTKLLALKSFRFCTYVKRPGVALFFLLPLDTSPSKRFIWKRQRANRPDEQFLPAIRGHRRALRRPPRHSSAAPRLARPLHLCRAAVDGRTRRGLPCRAPRSEERRVG